MAGFVGGALAAVGTAEAALEFVELGAGVGAAQDRLAAFAGGTSEARGYLEAFNEATDGTVDRMSAMESASKLLGMGLVENEGEMAAMAEMATRLGDQTMGAGERINDFALLLSNQSIQRLDNFNISSGRTRALIDELLASGQALSRDEAFKLAVMQIGAESLDKLGESTDTANVKLQKMRAAVTDAKTGFALMAAEAVAGAGGVDELASRVRRLPQTLEQVLVLQRAWTRAQQEFLRGGLFKGALEEFNNTLKQHAMTMAETRSASEEVRWAYTQQQAAVEETAVAAAAAEEPMRRRIETDEAIAYTVSQAAAALDEEKAALERNAEAVRNTEQAQLGLASSLKGASEAQIASAAIGELGRAQAAGDLGWEDYATAVGEVQLAFGLADEASVHMAGRITSLVGRLGEGTVAATEFDEELAKGVEIFEMEQLQIEKFGETLASRGELIVSGEEAQRTYNDEVVRNMDAHRDAEAVVARNRERMRDLEWQTIATKAETRRFREELESLPEEKHIVIWLDYRRTGDDDDVEVSVPSSAWAPEGVLASRGAVPVGGIGLRGGRAAGATYVFHNYFGRDSVRSDADIQAITEAQGRLAALRGVRIWEM